MGIFGVIKLIKNENIVLRPISKADTSFILKIRNDISIANNFFSDPPLYDFKHEEWLKNLKNSLYFVIYYMDNKCGLINISNIDYKNQKAEYGIVLKDECSGKGIAYNASILLIKYVFLNLNIRKIYLEVFSDNIKAIKLYKKLGFKEEGIFKNEIFKNGKYKDVIRMAIFKKEWLKNYENSI